MNCHVSFKVPSSRERFITHFACMRVLTRPTVGQVVGIEIILQRKPLVTDTADKRLVRLVNRKKMSFEGSLPRESLLARVTGMNLFRRRLEVFPTVPDEIPPDGELFVTDITFMGRQHWLVLCGNVLLEDILRLATLPTLLAHKILVLCVGEVVLL